MLATGVLLGDQQPDGNDHEEQQDLLDHWGLLVSARDCTESAVAGRGTPAGVLPGAGEPVSAPVTHLLLPAVPAPAMPALVRGGAA